MMQKNKNFVVYDLDGTLIRSNTFHRWIVALIIRSLCELNFKKFFKIFSALIARATNSISHKDLKIIIEKNSLDLDDAFVNKFASRLIQKNISSFCIHKLMLHIENGDHVILATAAPLVYAKIIAQLLDFDSVLASKFDSSGSYIECMKDIKASQILQYSGGRGINFFYSDHSDDLCSMRLAKSIFLINPTSLSLSIVSKELDLAPKIKVVYD